MAKQVNIFFLLLH